MLPSLRSLVVLAVILGAGVLVGSAFAQWRSSGKMPEGVERLVRPGHRIRVEVLNGGGRAGAAHDATDLLRDRGFDVVYFGNADAFGQDTSVVLDRVGSVSGAREVADALGIRNVRSEPDSNLYLDVSVVLGAEWAAEQAPAAPVSKGGRPWWDPTRWVRPSASADTTVGAVVDPRPHR